MSKLRIGVIFGGVSTEYDVSLQSAASVIDNLPQNLYDIVMIGITTKGRWLNFPGNTELIREDKWALHSDCSAAVISADRTHKGVLKIQEDGSCTLLKLDCVLPVIHGAFGEDGAIQGLLTMAGIPYVGCDTLSSALCLDKAMTHTLLDSASIPNAPWMCVNKCELNNLDSVCEKITERFGFPVFVKPANTGSSIGITKAGNTAQLVDAIKIAFTHDDKIVVEQAINGVEIEAAVLGTAENCEVAEPGMIIPANEFYDYEAKYHAGSETLVPARISTEIRRQIIDTAKQAFGLFGCHGMARVDFFVTDDGKVILNEINTIPGFTAISMYSKMFEYSGKPYPQLLQELIDLALERG